MSDRRPEEMGRRVRERYCGACFAFVLLNQLNNSSPAQLIWWLQIVADSQDWLAVFKQLFGYLRRILRERRFVFGLTLSPEMLTVWLHDKSGVIGTKTAIYIQVCEIGIRQNINTFFTCKNPSNPSK